MAPVRKTSNRKKNSKRGKNLQTLKKIHDACDAHIQPKVILKRMNLNGEIFQYPSVNARTLSNSHESDENDDSVMFVEEHAPDKVTVFYRKQVFDLQKELAAVKRENQKMKIQIETLNGIINNAITGKTSAQAVDENMWPGSDSWIVREIQEIQSEGQMETAATEMEKYL